MLGSAVLIGVVWAASQILPKRHDPWYYFFILCSWTCMVDLALLLETIGLADDRFELWLKIAEPYLDTTWGASVNLIDATVHYVLYMVMIKRQLEGKSYDKLGLFWAGSILNSMSVLLGSAYLGHADGTHEIKAGISLNIPYLILPTLFFLQQLFVVPEATEAAPRQTPITARLLPSAFLFIGGLVNLTAAPLLALNLECSNVFTKAQYYAGFAFTILLINLQLEGSAQRGKKMAYFTFGQAGHALLSTFLHCGVL
ncbi:unnamed protein product, partial [Mesorhabditis spiculigera]